jgi:transposase
MSMSKRVDHKTKALRDSGCLNRRPGDVADPLFRGSAFFDARDLVQVKYEMVRRVEHDSQTVTQAAAAFGFSRPSFYQAQATLNREGLAGLVPKRRGPRGGHKLTVALVEFLEEERAKDAPAAPELAARVQRRFGVEVHPRSIERALARREKKLRRQSGLEQIGLNPS